MLFLWKFSVNWSQKNAYHRICPFFKSFLLPILITFFYRIRFFHITCIWIGIKWILLSTLECSLNQVNRNILQNCQRFVYHDIGMHGFFVYFFWIIFRWNVILIMNDPGNCIRFYHRLKIEAEHGKSLNEI